MNRKEWIAVRVTGENPERFFNLCSYHGIGLEQIEAGRQEPVCGRASGRTRTDRVRTTEAVADTERVQESLGISVHMAAADFFRAAGLGRKAGVKLRITEKHGLFFLIRRYRKRLAFFVGMVGCAAFLYGSSLFIWDIHFEGNTRYTDAALLRFMKEQGYVHGMKKAGLVCEELEKKFRNQFEDLTWVSAQIDGNRLLIRVKENQAGDADRVRKETGDLMTGFSEEDEDGESRQKEETAPSETGMDLTAVKSGTVISIITRSGTPLVHNGDVVEAGQVLISGSVELVDEGGTVLETRQTIPDGEILAETQIHYEDSFPLTQEQKQYTGRSRTRHVLWLFGKRIGPLGHKDAYETEDREETYEAARLWGNFYLPVGIGTITEREYKTGVHVLTEAEAQRETKLRFSAFCETLKERGAVIEQADCKTVMENGNCKSYGTVTAAEEIGTLQRRQEKTDTPGKSVP